MARPRDFEIPKAHIAICGGSSLARTQSNFESAACRGPYMVYAYLHVECVPSTRSRKTLSQVSSWLGGHWSEADEVYAEQELTACRAVQASNVVQS